MFNSEKLLSLQTLFYTCGSKCTTVVTLSNTKKIHSVHLTLVNLLCTFGLSSALFWVEAAVVPAVVLLGVPCPGGPRMFGARIFSMPASCLAGWGCCSPHTLLNIYMEEPYEHKRDHTHRCTLKHSHWCKNRCSQTHIVLICCCFKTYFVILVRCAAQ